MTRAKRWTEGNVVAVPLEDGGFGFAVVVEEPLVAFFARRANTSEMPADISSAAIAFSIWVMNNAIGKANWSVVGPIELPPHVERDPWFFKLDVISGKYSLYRHPEEKPALREDCFNLERAAVWGAEHVESRLTDFLAGREAQNKWVRSLALWPDET